ncbi:MAG: hypothetical protein H0V17_11430 [Deltaproteobacteria bacterium]|nr:hypothetical protein [Deltaproteobacteria bacterium]
MRSSLVASVLAIACGDGPGERAIRGEPTLETFERRMCACTDPTCVKQVVQDMAQWSKLVKAPRPGDDTAAITARYNACMAKAR